MPSILDTKEDKDLDRLFWAIPHRYSARCSGWMIFNLSVPSLSDKIEVVPCWFSQINDYWSQGPQAEII